MFQQNKSVPISQSELRSTRGIRVYERDLREPNLGHLKPEEGGAPHAWSSSSIISTWTIALSYFGRVFNDSGSPTFIRVLASDSKLILPSRTAETVCVLGREESLLDENMVLWMGWVVEVEMVFRCGMGGCKRLYSAVFA